MKMVTVGGRMKAKIGAEIQASCAKQLSQVMHAKKVLEIKEFTQMIRKPNSLIADVEKFQ